MKSFIDAFISYGRADSKEFAVKLYQQLSAHGYRVWFDLHDIPLGVDYQQQIDGDLGRSHNFLFIMSPHSINSDYCRLEIERAVRQHKRIIPILHVDEISRETWHQRHPTGTDAEWADYQDQKLHFGDIRNPRIHPILEKLNWVMMREGQDDFAAGLAGIVNIFQRNQDYVHQHTSLLIQALQWEQNYRQSHNLLVGQQREQAEAWLKKRFKNDQPPCTSTDLHCEFITESIKNANNLMTQVFIAHAEKDAAIMGKIRRSLLREGITVWTSDTDIQTGEEFQQSINQGIERADNLIYLLSPNSVESAYCQQELDYALALNKRIIPILASVTEPEHQPDGLKGLQYIDLTDNKHEDDYRLDESQLLRILRTDEVYFQTHKVLLSKALKWDQQHRNPSILLRGFNLRQAETWLKTAKKLTTHPPISLQDEFITESLRQPPAESLDIFISYSRSDSDIARQLNEKLQINGKLTWFDQESIAASSADFQKEIYAGIEASDNFLFILSPRSVNSPYCADEVEYAAKLNKRFITILWQKVDVTDLHPQLAQVQWIDFSQSDEKFWDSFNQLVRVLETDREHVRQHSKWSRRAIEWTQKERTDDLLLRGGELAIAQNWLHTAQEKKKNPQPTKLQKTYLEACHQAHQKTIQKETRQQRLTQALLGLMTVAFIGALGVSIYAVSQRNRAEVLLTKQIGLLSDQARSLVRNGQELDGLVQATHAAHLFKNSEAVTPDDEKQVIDALQESLLWVRAINRVQAHTDEIKSMVISPDGLMIGTASTDNTAKIWSPDGELIQTLEHKSGVAEVKFTPDGQHLVTQTLGNTIKMWNLDGTLSLEISYEEVNNDHIWSLDISPDGKWVAIGGLKGYIQIWSLEDGQPLDTFTHGLSVSDVRFSPNSKYLVSVDDQTQAKLWSLDGTLLYIFEHPSIWDMIFSPNSQTLASRSEDGTVKLWSINGNANHTLELKSSVYEFTFSHDGQYLATATSNGVIQIWQAETGELIREFRKEVPQGFTYTAHEGKINSIHFSSDDQTIITASSDHTVKVWSLEGQELSRFKHQSEVWEAKPSPNGEWIASYDNQSRLRIWDLDRQPATRLDGHTLLVHKLDFSPDGQLIGTASNDGRLKLWNRDGLLLTTLTRTENDVPFRDFQFSHSGRKILAAGRNQVAHLFHRDGDRLQSFIHDGVVWWLQLSSDEQRIVTQQPNGLTTLWSESGDQLATLPDHYSPTFSPDGQMLTTAQFENLYLWELHAQAPHIRQRCVMKGPSDTITQKFTYSDDETMLLASYANGTARAWNFNCQQLALFQHGDNDVIVRHTVASPDNQLVVTVGTDSTVKLWSNEGTLLKTLNDHTAVVFQVLFSPDGQSFATAANDQTIKIWNRQGELLRTLWHPNEIWRMRYSPDGKQLLVAQGETPTLWNLDSEVLNVASIQYTEQLKLSPSIQQVSWTSSENLLAFGEQEGKNPSRLDTLMTQACSWLTHYLEREGTTNRDQELCKD